MNRNVKGHGKRCGRSKELYIVFSTVSSMNEFSSVNVRHYSKNALHIAQEASHITPEALKE